MAENNNTPAGFKKLMRYAENLAEYEKGKSEGIIDDNVFVIVLEEQLFKFKGKTGHWPAELGGGGIDPELLEGYMPLVRDFSDDFNNDFTR